MSVHQLRGAVVFNGGIDELGGCLAHFTVAVSAQDKKQW